MSELAQARLLTELKAFEDDVQLWWGTIEGANATNDPRLACCTHARLLRSVMCQASGDLRTRACGVSDSDPGARVRSWRDLERELGVVRAVAAELRGRIDARLLPATKDVLVAADEIVWSVHRGAMARLRAGDEPPVPLVSIGPEWGAEMVSLPRVTLVTRGSAAAAARRILEALSLHELRLPWASVGEPWLLAVLLHEIGHVIAFDIVPGGAFIPIFEQAFADALGPKRAQPWRGWAEEIFADACAVAAGGTAILPALVAWETTETAQLASPTHLDADYPPPIVRWELVRAWSERVGLGRGPEPSVLNGLGADSQLIALLAEVPAVVDALDQELPIIGERIRAFWSGDMEPFVTAIEQKRQDIVAGVVLPDGTMDGARAAIAAAVDLASSGPPAGQGYDEWRAGLRSRVLNALTRCHGPGTREAATLPAFTAGGAALIQFAQTARAEADGA